MANAVNRMMSPPPATTIAEMLSSESRLSMDSVVAVVVKMPVVNFVVDSVFSVSWVADE